MSLSDLYQEILIEHGKKPRNKRKLDGATHRADGFNPLCGDAVQLHLRVENDHVVEATFEGEGCAISTASASILTEEILGKSTAQIRELVKAFRATITGKVPEPSIDLGSLEALLPVKEYPMRVKCATLAWHTLIDALDKAIQTEDSTSS